MNDYAADPKQGVGQMRAAVEDWKLPKTAKDAPAGPVTVLFTDMVGSTRMTQEKGDAGAQEIVRTHNRIVRNALVLHDGLEIKHTGDGIMASFAATSRAVEAAIQIQRQATAHTQTMPDLPLTLKVGINAGEPIAEDNDLFGSTVQMAARIVDKAQAGQILVSDIVRGICTGKGLKFESRGTFPLKGFGDDVPLFEAIWTPAKSESESAPTPAPSPADRQVKRS